MHFYYCFHELLDFILFFVLKRFFQCYLLIFWFHYSIEDDVVVFVIYIFFPVVVKSKKQKKNIVCSIGNHLDVDRNCK